VLFILLVPLFFFILAFLYIMFTRSEIEKMPLETANAVVVKKRISYLHDDKRYYLSFQFNCEVREFKVYRFLYHNLNEGDIGVLSYRRGFFVNFEKLN